MVDFPPQGLGGPSLQTVRVLADQTNTANVEKSTTLTANLVANTSYIVKVLFIYTNASSSSLNYQIKNITNASLSSYTIYGQGTGSGSFGTNLLGTSPTSAIGSSYLLIIITMGATPSTLEIDFINPAATGTATIKAGSWMEIERVS